jgi:hypothetical protein
MFCSCVLTAAALGVTSAVIAADDAPRRKSGLWAMSVLTPGAAVSMTVQQCVDEKTDDITATMTDKAKPVCKSMKPGDVVMSNGMKFNVNDYKSANKK